MEAGRGWGCAREGCACGALVPLPAPSRNRGSAPDPAPQTPARLNLESGGVGAEPPKRRTPGGQSAGRYAQSWPCRVAIAASVVGAV
ncbi:hypothetical protein EAO72_21195 [Streptomyces sp. or43]|nr:hypothetical protein EAO72_21195 [Streptomyces sp. or43]